MVFYFSGALASWQKKTSLPGQFRLNSKLFKNYP